MPTPSKPIVVPSDPHELLAEIRELDAKLTLNGKVQACFSGVLFLGAVCGASTKFLSVSQPVADAMLFIISPALILTGLIGLAIRVRWGTPFGGRRDDLAFLTGGYRDVWGLPMRAGDTIGISTVVAADPDRLYVVRLIGLGWQRFWNAALLATSIGLALLGARLIGHGPDGLRLIATACILPVIAFWPRTVQWLVCVIDGQRFLVIDRLVGGFFRRVLELRDTDIAQLTMSTEKPRDPGQPPAMFGLILHYRQGSKTRRCSLATAHGRNTEWQIRQLANEIIRRMNIPSPGGEA